LDVPGEIERIVLPFSMAIGDKDLVTGPKVIEEIRNCLDKKRGRVGGEVVVYPGAKHGFAVRGNPRDEREREQGLQVEEQAVSWFGRWFGRKQAGEPSRMG
jgi:dienelactone hydrolase